MQSVLPVATHIQMLKNHVGRFERTLCAVRTRRIQIPMKMAAFRGLIYSWKESHVKELFHMEIKW